MSTLAFLTFGLSFTALIYGVMLIQRAIARCRAHGRR